MSLPIKNCIFFIIVSSLIFNNIPKPIQMNFIGGPVGNKLVFYPLLIGFIYTAYCQCKYKNVLVNFKPFVKYLSLYLGVVLLSLILGLFNYPYWNDVLAGPVNQIEKIPMVLEFFKSHGLEVDVKILTSLWIIVRQLKGVLLEAFWCFGGAYMIYCWYRNDWKQGLYILVSAIFASLTIILAYSFFEISYLMHSKDAADYLGKINPFIHEVKTDGKWWAPLLWKGQLRSVMAEPSYFGIYSSFVMPFLWYKLLKDKSILCGVLTFVMTFFLFLTKARTGFMLHIGQLFLLPLAALFFLRNTKYLKNTALVALCSIMAFIGSNYFIANYMDVNKNTPIVQAVAKKVVKKTEKKVAVNQGNTTKKLVENPNNKKSIDKSKKHTPPLNKAMTMYVDNNMTSLANPDKRSNRARYSIMEADTRIGLEHPFIGVGRGLRNGYIPDYLSEQGKKNGEVKMWLAFRKKMGIMRSGFPKLGEYTSRFGETGIFGLGVFLFPPLFLLWNMFKRLRDNDNKYKLECVTFIISLLGIMASGIGDTLNITYCHWVLLGLGYAMCFGKYGEIDNKCNERA